MAVLQATSKLATIRALSQYRPFEGGGASVRDAYQDLVVAALAEADGRCKSLDDCHSAIEALFRLDLELLTIAAALNTLKDEGRVLPVEGGGFTLASEELARLEEVARESQAMARQALADWKDFILTRAPASSDELAQMEEDLGAFLRAVIRRHGVEATLLLYPEAEEAQRLYESIEAEGFKFLYRTPSHLREVRDLSLSEFIRNPTDAQRAYLAQNLNTAYFLSVLSIDPEGARLLTEITRGQRVYLDTNFLYRLLGVQGPKYVRPAETILRITLGAGYHCCITPWTLDEFRESLRRSRDFLEKYPIPPGAYARLAAEAASDENFVTAYWREVRSGVKLVDFVQYYSEIETHLKERNIQIQPEGCTAVDQLKNDIEDQVSILQRVSHSGRFRHPALLEHDVKHRMLVERLREQATATTFANAGYWFLTHDSTLPRYDRYAAAPGELPFCVSAGAWFQIMEAFRAKTDDPEQSLADMLASPYVRFRRQLSLRSAAAIVARVEKFKDGTPELAARVLLNTAALEQIEEAEADEEQIERIDNAIIEAARQAQEDARRAREIADVERERASEIAEEARLRAEAMEKEARLAREVAEVAHRDELARAQARADEQLAAERERARRAEEDKKAALAAKDAEMLEMRTRSKQRALFIGAFVTAVIVFVLLDLAGGLKTAWSVLVAAAVLLGLGLGISQWARWRAGRDS